MCDAYFQFKSVQVDGGAPDTAQSAYLFKVDILQRLSGVDFLNGAQGGFQDTTRRTEDDTGAGRFSQRVVERAVQHEEMCIRDRGRADCRMRRVPALVR